MMAVLQPSLKNIFKGRNPMATKTFKEAYGVLQRHAQTLREQQEPNIDDLLSIVTESVDAYKTCQQRIEAVEKALEQALSDTGFKNLANAGPKDLAGIGKLPAPDSANADDGDIPF
jgi:exodeoxyribonuclease VII small subunit